MKNESKKKVSDLLVSFNKLPEASQDKLVCIAYGMQLATSGNGGNKNDRTAGKKRVASVS